MLSRSPATSAGSSGFMFLWGHGIAAHAITVKQTLTMSSLAVIAPAAWQAHEHSGRSSLRRKGRLRPHAAADCRRLRDRRRQPRRRQLRLRHHGQQSASMPGYPREAAVPSRPSSRRERRQRGRPWQDIHRRVVAGLRDRQRGIPSRAEKSGRKRSTIVRASASRGEPLELGVGKVRPGQEAPDMVGERLSAGARRPRRRGVARRPRRRRPRRAPRPCPPKLSALVAGRRQHSRCSGSGRRSGRLPRKVAPNGMSAGSPCTSTASKKRRIRRDDLRLASGPLRSDEDVAHRAGDAGSLLSGANRFEQRHKLERELPPAERKKLDQEDVRIDIAVERRAARRGACSATLRRRARPRSSRSVEKSSPAIAAGGSGDDPHATERNFRKRPAAVGDRHRPGHRLPSPAPGSPRASDGRCRAGAGRRRARCASRRRLRLKWNVELDDRRRPVRGEHAKACARPSRSFCGGFRSSSSRSPARRAPAARPCGLRRSVGARVSASSGARRTCTSRGLSPPGGRKSRPRASFSAIAAPSSRAKRRRGFGLPSRPRPSRSGVARGAGRGRAAAPSPCARRSGLRGIGAPAHASGSSHGANFISRPPADSGRSVRPWISPASFQSVGPWRMTSSGVIGVPD